MSDVPSRSWCKEFSKQPEDIRSKGPLRVAVGKFALLFAERTIFSLTNWAIAVRFLTPLLPGMVFFNRRG